MKEIAKESATFEVGQKIHCNGYPGSIVKEYVKPSYTVGYGWSAMYEVRLPGGICCVSSCDIHRLCKCGKKPETLCDCSSSSHQ